MLNAERIESMRRNPASSFGAGATPAEIDDAEKALGVVFPMAYRKFLESFGWGGVGDVEIFGAGADVPPYLDVTKLTLSERVDARPSLAMGLVPLKADGAGNYYCLDLRAPWNGTQPIVWWDHEESAEQEPDTVAEGFDDWFLELSQSW